MLSQYIILMQIFESQRPITAWSGEFVLKQRNIFNFAIRSSSNRNKGGERQKNRKIIDVIHCINLFNHGAQDNYIPSSEWTDDN